MRPARSTGVAAPSRLTRRRLLQLAGAAGIAALAWSWPRRASDVTAHVNLRHIAQALAPLEARLADAALGWLTSGRLVREDGFLYAIDLGLLSIYAASELDQQRYQLVRDFTVRHFLTDSPRVPELHHLVQWRVKPQAPQPDATGTTETLRLAKALWTGAGRFGVAADADLALDILRGYARHARVDQGIWFIANYFSLNARIYANNSFLVDYDPDFIADLAKARGDADLATLAENSYALVGKAFAPTGLIRDLVQPEVKTLVPELELSYFSPNDVCGIANCATVALTVARGRPAWAGRLLNFAAVRGERLGKYYYGRTGEPANELRAGAFEWATLTRLAATLGEADVLAAFLKTAMPLWQNLADAIEPRQAYLAAELLLSCAAIRRLAQA